MLKFVLPVLQEPHPSARARAMKVLSAVVQADPGTLELQPVEAAVQFALSEPSISVREATLDLLGQFILSRPAFVERYYGAIAQVISEK